MDSVYQDFEQKVKLLGDWLVFLKAREQEYQAQAERARRAGAPAEAQQEQEAPQEQAQPFFDSVRQEESALADNLHSSPAFNALRDQIASGEEKADRWV